MATPFEKLTVWLEVYTEQEVDNATAWIVGTIRILVSPTVLHLAEGTGEGRDVIHVAAPAAQAPVGVIEHIKHCHPQLDITFFTNGETLPDRGVDL